MKIMLLTAICTRANFHFIFFLIMLSPSQIGNRTTSIRVSRTIAILNLCIALASFLILFDFFISHPESSSSSSLEVAKISPCHKILDYSGFTWFWTRSMIFLSVTDTLSNALVKIIIIAFTKQVFFSACDTICKGTVSYLPPNSAIKTIARSFEHRLLIWIVVT